MVERARVGAVGFDCVTPITPREALALKAAGMSFAVRYLGGIPGSLTTGERVGLEAAGLGVMAVTYADDFNGSTAVLRAQAAGILPGVTVWLDVEGYHGDSATLIAKINAWAGAVRAAGYDPGIYVGAQALLTSKQLYDLAVDRYWHSMSRVVDVGGQLAEPSCGWCMLQLYPTIKVAGVDVDADVVQSDYEGRVPSWQIAA